MKSEFGPLAQTYDKIRPSYPTQIIKTIFQNISDKHPLVLDLGCGTGISTRQLAERTKLVIGCDIDTNMLQTALSHPHNNVAYTQSSADQIPFPNQMFHAVTAFTSFHWFANPTSLREIKRILKPMGILAIVQPKITSPFKNEFKQLIEQELGHTITPKYSTENITQTLTKAKFKIQTPKIIKVDNTYYLNDYITLLQSYSIWNFVPEIKRKPFIKKLKTHYKNHLIKNYIHETSDLYLYLAQK